ncbi:MAG: methyl-accepting chemotaxis protein [Deltaproteobacteria bacterium]|nr:methyl-accepting chemotaxis protein [Deltaproteobacteria bacterium]
MKALIQNLFRNFSIKLVLYTAIAGAGILIILLCGILFLLVYNWSKEADRLVMANELTDHIITAAGWEAIERGVTNTALSSDKPAESSMSQKIKDLRAKGDDEFKKGRAVAENLAAFDPGHTGFKEALKKTDEARKALEEARAKADASLGKDKKDFAPQEWFKFITNFIDANADLRQEAVISPSYTYTFSSGVSLNMKLKHAVWLASEYAGRERATIGGMITKGSPIVEEQLSKLNSFRAVVDLNIKAMLLLKNNPKTDAAIRQSIDKMEEVFLGKFQGTRKSVYEAAYLGNYPISASQWIDKSTEAINTILDVSTSAGKMVEKQVKEAKDSFRLYLYIVLIFFTAMIIGCIAIVMVIKYKVIEPVDNLMHTMTEVEQTGDLRVTAEVNTQDEMGQMTNTFNAMVKKMHDIAKEISIGVERVTSTAWHFQESFGKIVQDTEDQTQRAAQVATASTEMSATVIEIAKNASGASEAAKGADKAARKGGEMVQRTVEGMSDIAQSVRQSAEVISELGSRSNEIGKIIKVIDDIADQTNLLALNAAIEAARAGEQGRGFAVVADEVRKLAERTTKATKEIGEMIQTIQDDTIKAVSVMDVGTKKVENEVVVAKEAGEALEQIVDSVNKVTGMIQQIATAAEEQSTAADQISGDIEAVAGVAKETSAGANQRMGDVRDLSDIAFELKEMVSKFTMERRAGKRGPDEKVWTEEERERYRAAHKSRDTSPILKI